MKPFVLGKRVTLDVGIPPQSTKKKVSHYGIKNSASIKVSLDDLLLPSKIGLAKNLNTLESVGLFLLMCFFKNVTKSNSFLTK